MMNLLAIALALLNVALANPTSRQVIHLNSGWRFTASDVPGADAKDFVDAQWDSVRIPHSWPESMRGTGWYRLYFRLVELCQDRRVFLKIGAANQVAKVYINGHLVGRHQGGYTAFTFDITSLLEKDNVVAVQVTNLPNAEVAPISADYTFFGGMYRYVDLIVTPGVHISLLDDSSPGVYLTTESVGQTEARVEARVIAANDTLRPGHFEVEATVSGQTFTNKFDLQGGEVKPVSIQLTVPHPHLWNGRKDPFLYSVHVRLLEGTRVLDEVTQPLGIRSFSVDPNNGFTLNGEHLELRGVNMHQDRAGKGWALTAADRKENIRLLTEMGANAIRLSHYPHSDETLNLLDREGIVSWAEIPLINHVGTSAEFAASTRQQLLELIHQQYNHPSIFFWSLFNEVDGDAVGLVSELNKLAKSTDPSRLTTGASNQPFDSPINRITDVIAINRYDGWYYGKSDDISNVLQNAKKTLAPRAFGISEYGAGGSVNQHQDPPAKPNPRGRFHPEEYETEFHETYYATLANQKSLWGHFVWNLFDFSSWGRQEGEVDHINDKGLITYDRSVKKDAFYFYKAHWNPEPMVYITGRRYVTRPSRTVDVKVYSNQPEVELIVNGESLGKKRADTIFIWPSVSLRSGPNQIEAKSSYLIDNVKWSTP